MTLKGRFGPNLTFLLEEIRRKKLGGHPGEGLPGHLVGQQCSSTVGNTSSITLETTRSGENTSNNTVENTRSGENTSGNTVENKSIGKNTSNITVENTSSG